MKLSIERNGDTVTVAALPTHMQELRNRVADNLRHQGEFHLTDQEAGFLATLITKTNEGTVALGLRPGAAKIVAFAIERGADKLPPDAKDEKIEAYEAAAQLDNAAAAPGDYEPFPPLKTLRG